MKGKVVVLTLLLCGLLSGCKSEVTTDNRMKDSSMRENSLEYDAYRKNIVDSKYTWYSKYINQYLLDIKDREYKVNLEDLDSIIADLDAKIKEVKKLDPEKIRAAIDKESEDVSKNDKDDKKYKANIENIKADIEPNKNSMLKLLNRLRTGLELGKDGQFDQNDVKKLSEIESSLLKVYDEKLKPY